MNMKFRQLNPHSCCAYLIGAEGSNEVVIIDPVLEHVSEYLEMLDSEKLKLTHLIDTHTHADHISGGSALVDQTGCEYVMYIKAPAPCVTFRIGNGMKWDIAGIPVDVIHTPGHTKDSICLIFPDRIFTGDTLFLDDGGAGRDDLPGGDPSEHWESLQRILTLPDHLTVYPAHEYRNRQPSSLKEQKERNPHLKPRTKKEFVEYLEDLKLGPADWMADVLKANYACARDPGTAWIPADVNACEVKGTLEHGVNDLKVAGIPARELKERLDSGRSPILLDVRESDELTGELGHLPNSLHVSIGSLSGRLDELEPHKGEEIVTVCRSGARATTAAQILTQVGFDKIQVLTGGMLAWNKAGYPTSRKK